KKSETRMRNIFLVRRFGNHFARLHEVMSIDAAWKRKDRVVLIALRLIQSLAAGENEIRELEQFAFTHRQTLRRVFEGRELVHAVVHDGERMQMPREIKGHRRVVP